MPLKDGRKEDVDLVRRFRKGYLKTRSSSWKNVRAHSVIPSLRAMGLHVPEVPASAEVPRHDGPKTFGPSWTKVV